MTVRDAIADLPEIENGHMVDEMEYVGGLVRIKCSAKCEADNTLQLVPGLCCLN